MALFFRGYHPQATLGTFTSGATAARLLALNEEQTLHALGIAATQAAGLMSAQEGSMVKRMHSGRAAQSGVYAALLARKGFTGIVDVIEAGYGGFLSTYSGDPKPEKLTEGLGEVWELPNVGFKPHATVTSIHTALDALKEIMTENRLQARWLQKRVTIRNPAVGEVDAFGALGPDRQRLPAPDGVLGGEVVVYAEDGTTRPSTKVAMQMQMILRTSQR